MSFGPGVKYLVITKYLTPGPKLIWRNDEFFTENSGQEKVFQIFFKGISLYTYLCQTMIDLKGLVETT